jgi:hypothetical protein
MRFYVRMRGEWHDQSPAGRLINDEMTHHCCLSSRRCIIAGACPLRIQGAPAPAPIKNFVLRSPVALFPHELLARTRSPSCTPALQVQRLVPYPNDAQIRRPAEVSKRGRRVHQDT